MSEPGAIQQAEEISTADHPLPRRTLLVRNHPEENVEKILTITQRLRDVDSDHFEYILQCPTHTASYRYHGRTLQTVFATQVRRVRSPNLAGTGDALAGGRRGWSQSLIFLSRHARACNTSGYGPEYGANESCLVNVR
ncbi:hypothetical protein [Halocatena marina]|uniref:Uncharacterized protein n=1 Tax=Halocatena marina TaxID=2934937 RepID=A0ABD5YXI4_9EURY|nr:hypothetical protein [Halocatena marina]